MWTPIPDVLKRVALANVQEGVPEAIATLIEGGMRVWMITGDKQETAVRPADWPRARCRSVLRPALWPCCLRCRATNCKL